MSDLGDQQEISMEAAENSTLSAPANEKDDKNDEDRRTNFAILHFAMMAPKYSISLFMFLAAGCIPLSTPSEAIHQPLTELHRLVKLEGDSYLKCTEIAFDRAIHSELKLDAQKEYDRVHQSQRANKKLIQRGQELSHRCHQAAIMARNSLRAWNANNDKPAARKDEMCTSDDQAFLDSFFGNDNSTIFVEDELSLLVDTFVQSNSKSLERIKGYAKARFEYDFDYFVTNRIKPTLSYLQQIQDQLTVESISFMIDWLEVETKLKESLKQMTLALDVALTKIDAMSMRLQEYTDSITEFYSTYSDIYQRLLDGSDFVRDFLPVGDIPEYFDISSVPLAHSLVPDSFSFEHGAEDLIQSTQEILDRTTEQCLDVLWQVQEEMEKQAIHKLRGSATEFSKKLTSLLGHESYDPPKLEASKEGIYTLDQEIEDLQSMGQATRNRAQAVLDHLQPIFEQDLLQDNARVDATLPAWNQSSSSSFVEGTPTTIFEYLQPIFPDLSIPEILRSFASWILNNTWIIEMLVQTLRLLALEAKYSRGAIPDLPVIDYTDGDDDNADSNKEEHSMTFFLFKTAFSACTSPGYILVLILIPLCFGAMVIWRPHVHSNCRETRQGTYLANQFLAPLLINEANARGNAYYIKGEMECHHTQRSSCDEMQLKLETFAKSDIATHNGIQLQRNQSVHAMQAMHHCFDLESNAQQMDEACCGLKGFRTVDCHDTNLICPIDESTEPMSAFHPLKAYLDETACLEDAFPWELKDEHYSCVSRVDPCNSIPCSGVNEELLLSRTIETDCKVELYVLDCCSFVLMVVYHLFAINLICTMLFQGVRQVCWSKLCPNNRLEFRSLLDKNGELVKGIDREDRSVRQVKATRRLQKVGMLKLAIGVVAFLCWVSSTFIVRQLGAFENSK